MNIRQRTDRESRHLALKIAAEKTAHYSAVETILENAKKLLVFLIGDKDK